MNKLYMSEGRSRHQVWLALALWLASASALAAGLPELIAGLKPGVVAVGTLRPPKRMQAERPPVTFLGSGFAVGDGRYLVTNAHVIPESLDSDNDERLAVFSGRGEAGRGHPVTLVRQDRTHDLAILKLDQGRLPPLPLAPRALLPEGTDIALTGFPIGMVLGLHPVTHRGIVSAVTPLVMPAHSSRSLTAEQVRRLKRPFDVYQLDVVAFPGNSGSAVYDLANGQVVGVVNSVFVKQSKEAILSSPSGITYAVPVNYVHDLLDGLD